MEREIEVKVLNMDLDQMEEKIQSLGGELISKEMQINTLIDSSKAPIKSFLDAYLRIRESKDLIKNEDTTTLTLKKNSKNKSVRDNTEINISIGDKDEMLLLLKELGYDNIEVGYKSRTSYLLNGARLDMDTWDEKTYPYPYMEIEAPDENKLEEIVELLHIPRENISVKSIVELRTELKRK